MELQQFVLQTRWRRVRMRDQERAHSVFADELNDELQKRALAHRHSGCCSSVMALHCLSDNRRLTRVRVRRRERVLEPHNLLLARCELVLAALELLALRDFASARSSELIAQHRVLSSPCLLALRRSAVDGRACESCVSLDHTSRRTDEV